MTLVLLTGAGFSKGWGGRLASDVFNYLLKCDLSPRARQLLFDRQDDGGFEAVIDELPLDERARFVTELFGMFNQMNGVLERSRFEPVPGTLVLRDFLAEFDAIFTLNQDLLFEHHYDDLNLVLAPGRRWDGFDIVGAEIEPVPNQDRVPWRRPVVDQSKLRLHPRMQPYFKLHGSSKWLGSSGGPMLVVGGTKREQIDKVPSLKWMYSQFREFLQRGNTRLVVIGFGFQDEHINEAIAAGVKRGLSLYIVDPAGVDAMRRRRSTERLGSIPNPEDRKWFDAYRDHVKGCSPMGIKDVFNGANETGRIDLYEFMH